MILECRHLANGCVLKCGCIGLTLFWNLSCLGTIICYINTIRIVPAYAFNVCDALVASCANVHDTKWTPHVKRQSDVAVIALVFSSLSKEGYKKYGSYLPPCNVLVAFGVVLVTPPIGWCVIIDVRIASSSAKSPSTQSQWCVNTITIELRRADDVTRDRRRECLNVTIIPQWLWVTYYTPSSRGFLLQYILLAAFRVFSLFGLWCRAVSIS